MPTKRKKNERRRRNRKINFSELNYVEKNFMQKGKAVIPIKLEKISDLYLKHDYKQMELSDEVCSYIEEIAYMVPIDTDIVLEIHCPEINEEEQNKIKKSIKNNYGMEIDDDDYDIKINHGKSIVMAIAGIILLIFNVLIEEYSRIFSNFISVVWWVAIWNLTEIQFGENTENRWKRLNHLQLYDANVTFVFDNGKIEK